MAGETHAGVSPTRTWRTARRSRRCSQRGRLLEAMTQLAALEGFTDVSVGQVIARAGVSRATFYEYFTDKEECFAAALAPLASCVRASVREAVVADRPERATQQATLALVAFACSQPVPARLLLSDTLTGGPRARDLRDGLIADAARIIDDAHKRAPRGAVIPDLPSRLIVGVSARLLASWLRHGGEPPRPVLAEEILGWLAAYAHPVAHHRWGTLAALQPARSPFLPPTALRPPPALAPGRPRIAEEAVVENQWLRIVFATAEVVGRDGYAGSTVAEITRVAGVEPRVFYGCFAGKRQAFGAVGELLFRHTMAVTAGAFVAGESWPERVWEAARALTQSAEQNPTLASVSLLESHLGAQAATHRVGGLVRAFTIFLQEGARDPVEQVGGSPSPPAEPMLDAIGTAVFEHGYQHAREHGAQALSCLHPHVVFIALTPFLGAIETSDLLHQKTPHPHVRALPASAKVAEAA
jgi:AcrR family transcriptional regulator